MATLKYKTPEGEWKKVSIGGGGSTEEVYVGSDEPTDENIKVWIDPTGTPSGGNGGSSSAGVEVIYFLPMGAVDAIRENGIYVFSADEAAEFRKIFSNIENMIIACKYDTPYTLQEDRCHYTAFSQYCMKAEEGVYIEAHFPEATPISNAIQSDTILILEDGDNIVAQL